MNNVPEDTSKGFKFRGYVFRMRFNPHSAGPWRPSFSTAEADFKLFMKKMDFQEGAYQRDYKGRVVIEKLGEHDELFHGMIVSLVDIGILKKQ